MLTSETPTSDLNTLKIFPMEQEQLLPPFALADPLWKNCFPWNEVPDAQILAGGNLTRRFDLQGEFLSETFGDALLHESNEGVVL